MRAAAGLALFLVGGGCYAPAAAPGSYECDEAGDRSCPANLTCKCGTCVKGDDDAACSLRISFSTALACNGDTATTCVLEGQEFDVTLKAYAGAVPPANEAQVSKYSGTAIIESTWGHARARPFKFDNGVATAKVTLDRATPPNSSLVLSARAGTASGVSFESLVVDPPALTVDATAAVTTHSTWAGGWMGYPSVVRGAAGHTMFFAGVPTLANNPVTKIGVASSSDGKTWTPAALPVLSTTDGSHLIGTSALRRDGNDILLFVNRASANFTVWDIAQTTTSDGGMTFTALDRPLGLASCTFCERDPSWHDTGLAFPSVLIDPSSANGWRMYFTRLPSDPTVGTTVGSPTYNERLRRIISGTTLGLARTIDQGATWRIDPVPTPGSGMIADIAFATSAQVSYDATRATYRMYYNQTTSFGSCSTELRYATSADGLFWTGTRRNPVLTASAFAWASSVLPPSPAPNLVDVSVASVVPGTVLPKADGSPGEEMWVTVTAEMRARPMNGMPAMTVACLPIGVGRVVRN